MASNLTVTEVITIIQEHDPNDEFLSSSEENETATDPDINKRAYSVWVSEVMLQQTQVATVIDYYNKWMKKWPTLQDLAKATLEEVNELWSGLGYYSRGRRLHEGAQKIVKTLSGEMPKNAESLLKELPGVGRYTAGAISSIAYNEQTGLVDGNVIRVLSRLRMIGSNTTTPQTMDAFWYHANQLVPAEHPGDFNQAMMELGATVCTPKTPACSQCPVRTFCKASSQVEANKREKAQKLVTNDNNNNLLDIECLVEDCRLCLDKTDQWDPSLGVCNYPRKEKKKASREERTAVGIVSRLNSNNQPEYFISQRPPKGLLAGLWEFPSAIITDKFNDISETLYTKHNIPLSSVCKRSFIEAVVHIFSHIHQTYLVDSLEIESDIKTKNGRWVTKDQFLESAVSTAMKKIFKAYEKTLEPPSKGSKRKRENSDGDEKKKQMSINSFFKIK